MARQRAACRKIEVENFAISPATPLLPRAVFGDGSGSRSN